MSSSPGFLEFFVLEASEYVEQLDALLLAGEITRTSADSLQRVARALRGTATMAKLPSFAELAAGIERVGRALHQGTLAWDASLGGALIAAVDDLRTLLHAARSWSPAETQRADARAAELAKFVPEAKGAPTPAKSQAHSFFATEASNIAAGIELLTTRPNDPATAANVLGRARALRGVAAVKEVLPLADVLEATEESTRTLELEGEALSVDAVSVLTAAAALLRRIAAVMRDGGDVNAPGVERERFTAAYGNWSERQIQRQRVTPIAEFFYRDDIPGLVDAAKNPPTSMADRLRLELVSLGEHLRGLIAAARVPSEAASSGRTRREFHRALRALELTADSFGHTAIVEHVRAHRAAADRASAQDLALLEALAKRLSDPGTNGEHVVPAPAAPARPAPAPAVPAAAANAPSAPAPAARPSDAAALNALDAGIAALESLSTQPFGVPVQLADEPVVPIDQLIYRGPAALSRAVAIRDELRRSGASSDPAALDELFDLVELAQLAPTE